MDRIFKFTDLLLRKLRLSNPWRYKVPFLISVPYFMVLVTLMPLTNAFWGLFWSAMTIFGIAGFGYLVNDYTDREEDRKAGKMNVLDGMYPALIGLLLLLFLALAIVPWVVFFPMDGLSIGLLISEFSLFVLYSLPPFRLKERGWAGVLCDALYAHAVPALLAANTFFLLGGGYFDRFVPCLLVLGSWQLVLGIRNILLHQLADLEKDLQTGTTTQVASKGRESTLKLLRNVFVPLEIMGFGLFALLVSFHIPYFIPVYLFFLLQVVAKRKFLWGQTLPNSLRQCLYIYLDDFYQEWIAVIVLLALGLQEPLYFCLLGIHIVLFRNAISTLAKEVWRQFGQRLTKN